MDKLIPFVLENIYWSIGLLVLIIGYFLIEFRNRNFGVPEISPQSGVLLANREKAKWVDIRPSALYQAGHISDAISFDPKSFDKSVISLKRFQKAPLIIVCERGISAKPIAAKLKKLGYQVRVLQGGMTAWRKAEMPLSQANSANPANKKN